MKNDGARGEGVAFLITGLISRLDLVRPEALRVSYLNSYLSIGGPSCIKMPANMHGSSIICMQKWARCRSLVTDAR